MEPSSLLQKLLPTGVIERDVRHQERDGAVGPDDRDRSVGRLAEAAQEPPAVGRDDFNQPRWSTTLDELVPLQVQRAGIVGLELEPAALELFDFAGDAIAVGERDDVGAALPRAAALRAARGRSLRGSREHAIVQEPAAIDAPPGRLRCCRYFGRAAYGLPPSAFEMSAIARCARTLLPASSSGGDTTAMPNLPGDTAMRPPPTPLLAGRPVQVEPLARVVVQAGRRHHGEHARHLGRIHDLLAGDRVLAAERQRRGHRRQVLRVHADRALTRVEIDGLLPVALDVAVGEHQRADGLVALVGVGLRLVDVLQHGQLPARRRRCGSR